MKRLPLAVLACIPACRGAGAGSEERAPEPLPVGTFVRAIHPHGVPYDTARAYGPDAVPRLLEMLADTAEQPHWTNIVVTLCAIADERAVAPVLEFIERGAGRLGRDAYAAKSSAVVALGYVVHATGNRRCLDYLKTGVRPSAWSSRGIRWTPPDARSWRARDAALSRKAILGLALTGHPEAARTLRSLQWSVMRAEVSRAAVGGTVESALDEHAKVRTLGLSGYYERAREERSQ